MRQRKDIAIMPELELLEIENDLVADEKYAKRFGRRGRYVIDPEIYDGLHEARFRSLLRRQAAAETDDARDAVEEDFIQMLAGLLSEDNPAVTADDVRRLRAGERLQLHTFFASRQACVAAAHPTQASAEPEPALAAA